MHAEGEADWSLLQARATALSAAIEAAGARLEGLGMEGEVAKAAACFASSDRVRGEREERGEGECTKMRGKGKIAEDREKRGMRKACLFIPFHRSQCV